MLCSLELNRTFCKCGLPVYIHGISVLILPLFNQRVNIDDFHLQLLLLQPLTFLYFHFWEIVRFLCLLFPPTPPLFGTSSPPPSSSPFGRISSNLLRHWQIFIGNFDCIESEQCGIGGHFVPTFSKSFLTCIPLVIWSDSPPPPPPPLLPFQTIHVENLRGYCLHVSFIATRLIHLHSSVCKSASGIARSNRNHFTHPDSFHGFKSDQSWDLHQRWTFGRFTEQRFNTEEKQILDVEESICVKNAAGTEIPGWFFQSDPSPVKF